MKEREIRTILEQVRTDLATRRAARKVAVPAALVGASLALLVSGCGDSDEPTPSGGGGSSGGAGAAGAAGNAGSDAAPPNEAGSDVSVDTTSDDVDAGPQIEYGGPIPDVDSGPQIEYMAPDAGDQDVDSGPQMDYAAPHS